MVATLDEFFEVKIDMPSNKPITTRSLRRVIVRNNIKKFFFLLCRADYTEKRPRRATGRAWSLYSVTL